MPKAKKVAKSIEYNPAHESHGYKAVRFVENVSRGLRLVGFADEIAKEKGHWRSIGHTGWFTDDYQSDKYRGVVYRLPARDGESLYVYGYDDPNNKDCAVLCFETEADMMEAARAADRFSELHAEEAREFNEAWQAGRRAKELTDEAVTMRKEALALAEEMRAVKSPGVAVPTICATLRSKVRELYHEIQKARKERDGLIADFGRRPGFVE